MKGKSVFTEAEINKLRELIKIRNRTNSSQQKAMRGKMRAIGFYGKDDWGIVDLQISDLEDLIKDRKIKIADSKATLLNKDNEIQNIRHSLGEHSEKTYDTEIKTKSTTVGSNSKTSFDPISNSDTAILILGTMPGDKSLELGEYYGHPSNRFWKVVSTITNNGLPFSYCDKKTLLLKSKIGIWDVAHNANRKGSLDSAIKDETPNDLTAFISRHKELKVIGFNGKKAEKLYDKYFFRRQGIEYISLPSTSPANAGISFDELCKKWQQIFIKVK